ncbi:MAG: Quinone oxidoreductase [Acidimicrobiaceae bacterium]|nr:Quinone oxidoreductase [Acidimicrobiaceae bacterium]
MPGESAVGYLAERHGTTVSCAVVPLELDELGEGEVLVAVEWSSVNYKDALATRPDGGVARLDRLVLGIDLAGTVLESSSPEHRPGEAVLVHGYGLGVSHHGGFATHARVPASWVVGLPAGLTAREAMILGTAGFTAALSVVRLQHHGIGPSDGPVLVTGATGGVGSFSVAMLSLLGFEVVASTGKEDAAGWLGALGASSVIGREELSRPGRPLEAQRYAGAVDCVGGSTLGGVLRTLSWGGAVAASGVTGGAELVTTVFPFILRAVSLLGVDSTQTSLEERAATWERIATELRPADLETFVAGEIGLGALGPVLDRLLAGGARGRYLVRPG